MNGIKCARWVDFPGLSVVAVLAMLSMGGRAAQGKDGTTFAWQEPQAKVLDSGDLEYAPRPFVFESGKSVRYIDFDGGSDDADGKTRETAWKHHPWDPQATGEAVKCAGIHTYVFKRGVWYRGEMQVRESGSREEPIRLTSDPDWGKGEAVICGSDRITGTWITNAKSVNKLIPEPEKVWTLEKFNHLPRTLWIVNADGSTRNVPLARQPNWKVSNLDDFMSEWWTWKQPPKVVNGKLQTKGAGVHFGRFVTSPDGRVSNLGIDPDHFVDDPEYYKGVSIWSEFGWVMGKPFASGCEGIGVEADGGQKGLKFGGIWGGAAGSIICRGMRYFLEGSPRFLDDPEGEYWGDKKSLYLRLPDGVDPNTLQIEAGRRGNLVDIRNQSHIHISGLSFRYADVLADPSAGPWFGDDVYPAVVRALGSIDDLSVRNCKYEEVNAALYVRPDKAGEKIDNLVFNDNQVNRTFHNAVVIMPGGDWGEWMPPFPEIHSVEIMRNRVSYAGLRPARYQMGDAIAVQFGRKITVAGNFVEYANAAGINVYGGKSRPQLGEVPFVRVMVFQNKSISNLRRCNDFGNIETWQGGPAYVFNNVSGDPGGYWNHAFIDDWNLETANARFGHAYYMDGAFKQYYFNNIGWGKSSDPNSPLGACSMFQEIIGFEASVFNNTAARFVTASRRQAPEAGRNKYMGNIFSDIGFQVFRHAEPYDLRSIESLKGIARKDLPKDRSVLEIANEAAIEKERAEKKERERELTREELMAKFRGNQMDAGDSKKPIHHESNAYTRNVFHKVNQLGVFEKNGYRHKDLDSFRKAMEEKGQLKGDVGVVVDKEVLTDVEHFDFRPREDVVGTIDGMGVKVFVPWALSMEVAEWHFAPVSNAPTRILDSHWSMPNYLQQRERYYEFPMFDLTGVNITRDSFVKGVLEDWTEGALKFDGKAQYATLDNATVSGPFEYAIQFSRGGQKAEWQTTVSRSDFKTPQVYDSNFILEVFAAVEKGAPAGVLLEKMGGQAGYGLRLDAEGRLAFSIRTDGKDRTVISPKALNDGQWHHVLAECVRRPGKATDQYGEYDTTIKTLVLYVDGQKVAEQNTGLLGKVSLANEANFHVAGTPEGHCLPVTMEYARVALGSLADAQTTIEELYAWEFDGPCLRDFAGSAPKGKGRDAGALER